MELCFDVSTDPLDSAWIEDRVHSETLATTGLGDAVELAVLARDGDVICGGMICPLDDRW